jgi:hypothetical protein
MYKATVVNMLDRAKHLEEYPPYLVFLQKLLFLLFL